LEFQTFDAKFGEHLVSKFDFDFSFHENDALFELVDSKN
jgi:hypothetical protein